MTTTPVMSITDEKIAEIELDIAAQAALKPGQCEGGVVVRGEICRECGATPKDSCRRPLPKSYAVPSNITALISRLRAAEKDVGRYRWLRDTHNIGGCVTVMSDYDRTVDQVFGFEHGNFDDAIDKAMEQSK